jgi:flagellar hook protein FlgE
MAGNIMQALYNSVSGLFSFSQSLDTISNNISNMNTPGFRGSDSFFENVMDNDGTEISGTGIDTSEGQIEQTSTDTDVAIQGNGFFILKDSEGNLYYTRSGQFEFNSSGELVDSVNQYLVQGYSSTGSYGDINISSLQTLPAQATTTVNMVGNIETGSSPDSIGSVTVYDAQGTAHVLTVALTHDTAKSTGGNIAWDVAVTDSSGNTLGTGTVAFSASGSPVAGSNTVTLTASLGGASQNIEFNFGTPGSLSGATDVEGETTGLTAQVQDGHGVIGISSEAFDTTGTLQLTYADGSTHAGPQLALATFPDQSQLTEIQGNLYLPPTNQTIQIGRPSSSAFGSIEGSSLEESNVDLTQELADMIVIQRGYQASSRVMTVSSDMLQQLYEATQSS